MRRGSVAVACVMALVAAMLLGGGAQADATSPAAARAATVTPDQARELGRQAYDYGFPLLEVLRVRREETSVRCPDAAGNAPVNSISNAAGFANPEARTVVAPNTDTLYSIAHLDLKKGAVVIRHPDMGKRYFVFELLDPYTNVVGYIGSRTTGSKAGSYAVEWRGHGAKAPKGVPVIRSDYRRLWVIGRTLAGGPADQKKAQKLMARYRISNLAGKSRSFPSGCKPGSPKTYPTPKDGAGFLTALDRGLAANPPPARDKPLLTSLAAVGVGPGLSPEGAGLSPDALAALYAGVSAEAAALPVNAKLAALKGAVANGGWYQVGSHIGAYGTDYSLRALVATVGLGANTAPEAIYPSGITDSTGTLYSGANRYRLVFARGQEPPARYFWSLTMYDSDGYLVANPINRYSVGTSHPPLVRQADGSIVIDIQHDQPTEDGVNWLPAPATGFRVTLRLYGPSKSALNGAWTPPPVTRVGG